MSDDQIPYPETDNSRQMWGAAVAAVLLAALVVTIILQLMDASRARDEALVMQGRSYEFIYQLKSLDSTIGRSEAALGRFAIAPENRDAGREFQNQWNHASAILAEIEKRSDVTSRQKRKIAVLRASFEARGELLSSTALSANYRQDLAAISKFYAASRDATRGQADSLIDALIDSERAELTQRVATVRTAADEVEDFIVWLALLGVAVTAGAVGLGFMALQSAAQRRVARREVAREEERTSELESAVALRTSELEAANRQLRTEADERAATEARLRQAQKMEAVGQLTGGIAHDFNNMLAIVVGGVELALRRLVEAPDRARHHLESALDGAHRATTLTRRLLAFARAEPVLPEAVCAATAISEFTELIDRTIGDRIDLQVDVNSGDWSIWVDRHQFENVLLNLAVNARDAMDSAGTLTIATGQRRVAGGQSQSLSPGDYVAICVSDTGCGMSADVVERIFDPFYTTKPVGQGTGLGMSQVFGFVKQSHGDVEVATAPGDGTTVTLLIPRFAAVESIPDPVDGTDSAASNPGGTVGSLTILVVEDDPRVLVATTGAVQELGHDAIACSNPVDAAGLMAQNPGVDLILSDVLMPEMTGPEMVRGLQNDWPEIAVLFVTGYTGEGGDAAMFGGHDVLRKPFTLAQLERAIGLACQKRASGVGRIEVAG